MFVFDILPCLFLAALWSPDWEGLASMRFCMRHFLVLFSLSHKVSWSGVVLDCIDS